jgi:hypothetical protein
MGKYQNTWSHRTKIIFREIKIIFQPFGNLAGFPARAIVLWQENARGTQNASLAGDRYNGHSRKALVLWVWFLNVFKTFQWTWDMLASSILHVCIFLVSFWYNKTFMACGFRNYEILFTHEYAIPLGRCPQGIWYYWVNTFSYFPHQHAIYVYYSPNALPSFEY